MQVYGDASNNFGMEYKDRIKAARKHAGLTQSQLAAKVGIDQASISDLERGRSQRSSYNSTIAQACGVSSIWLEAGIGTMLQDDGSPGLDAVGVALAFDSNVVPALAPTRFFTYPEISWVQAGSPSEAMDLVNIAACPTHPSDAWAGEDGFWLKVSGASMTSASGTSFPEGMLILVAPDIEPRSGQYVVARMLDSNEATFKQLIRDAGDFYLKPLNPAYPTKMMDDTWVIVGTVIDGKMPKSAFML